MAREKLGSAFAWCKITSQTPAAERESLQRQLNEKKEHIKYCKRCIYFSSYCGTCDYLLLTGKSRVKNGVKAGKECTVREVKGRHKTAKELCDVHWLEWNSDYKKGVK